MQALGHDNVQGDLLLISAGFAIYAQERIKLEFWLLQCTRLNERMS